MQITVADNGAYVARFEGPSGTRCQVTAPTVQQLRRAINRTISHWRFDPTERPALEQRFLDAWKASIVIAGEHNFTVPAGGVRQATKLEQLRPQDKVDGIEEGQILSERRFLAFLLSVYSPGRGFRYWHENRCQAVQLVAEDPTRAWLMAELTRWHPGRNDW